jgi:hypothetical protein
MPDYSDEEIDKLSDDVSESDELVLNDVKVIGKNSHENKAFINDDDPSKLKRGIEPRSKDDDAFNPLQASRVQAKHNRRSRRLQKKNSLDVQFRRRFSMLRDGNGSNGINPIYNGSEILGVNGLTTNNNSAFNNNNGLDFDDGTGISVAGGRDSRVSGMAPSIGLRPRQSSGNLSTKILDKRFNKMLFNMNGIPVRYEFQYLLFNYY